MVISQDRLEQIFKYLVVEVSMKRLASETKRMMKRMRNYGLITMAALIYAIAISLFLDPNNIAPGGITGVAILLKRFTDISVGTWNMLINIPIVILGLWKFGYKFIISTMYALIWITVFTDMLAPFGAVTNDLLIASVIGGGLMAINTKKQKQMRYAAESFSKTKLEFKNLNPILAVADVTGEDFVVRDWFVLT